MVMYEGIQDAFSKSDIICLRINNNEEFYSKDNSGYKDIMFYFEKMIVHSHQMPALSVSLDEETRNAIKQGVWLEFIFYNEGINNDLLFDSLLVEVNEGFQGFNIIRKYNNKYEGRCFYIDLNNTNMNELYNYLTGK